MNKKELQHQTRNREKQDTLATNNWLAQHGFDASTFSKTNIRLLKAQQQANLLLSEHRSLLSSSQVRTLEIFQQQMADKHKRAKLQPQAATSVLKISKTINCIASSAQPDTMTRS